MRMKKRFKCLLAAIISLAILLSGAMGTGVHNASAAELIRLLEGSEFELKPGEVKNIKLSVTATDYYARNPIFTFKDESGAFIFSKPKLYVGNTEVNSIGTGLPTDVIFDVTARETVKIGTYPITVNIKYETIDLVNGGFTEGSAEIYLKFQVNEEKVPPQLTVSNVYLSSSNIGSNAELVFTVKNEGETLAKNAYMMLDFGDDKEIEEKYTVKNIKLGDMAKGDVSNLKLPISILPTAKTGRKKITAKFTYKYADGSEEKASYDFYINITDIVQVAKIPKLVITDVSYDNNLKPGDSFTLKVKLKNIGGAMAENVIVAVDNSSISASGIIKNYFMSGINIDDIIKNAEATAEIPLKIAKSSTGGLLPVKLAVTYTDINDATYSFDDTIYVDVATVVTEPEEKPNLVISNVTQKPSKPVAGNEIEVSFDLENKGKADAKELKIYVEGLSEDTFIPVNPDPYQYYDILKSGKKMRVNIPLLVSHQIPEGLNNLKVKIVYNDNYSIDANIPVKNVQNDAAGISKPVLLISNYTTDVEELKAGTVFNLTFEIYNTNASTAAKNIKVTVKKPTDPSLDVFTLTQGNNSFFISKINPEESASQTIQMKVKANASTQAYPVVIQVEYEYEGLKPDPQTGNIKGIEMSADLNLQVIENARPVIDNAYVYSWDGPVYVGAPATLHFDFYNMGRSQLNNVTVTVEGDFLKSDGSMYFIGTTQAGGSSYGDFDVEPQVAGTAKCILKVTYEDSNGDVQEYVHEFTTEVMEAGGMMYPDMGGYPDDGEVFNPGGVMPKKNIVPLWAFILIQCAILIIFVPVTRKIIISVYRARLLKKEQEKY